MRISRQYIAAIPTQISKEKRKEILTGALGKKSSHLISALTYNSLMP